MFNGYIEISRGSHRKFQSTPRIQHFPTVFHDFVNLSAGKPPCSYGFPMVFPFSYGFSYDFPIFRCFFRCFLQPKEPKKPEDRAGSSTHGGTVETSAQVTAQWMAFGGGALVFAVVPRKEKLQCQLMILSLILSFPIKNGDFP